MLMLSSAQLSTDFLMSLLYNLHFGWRADGNQWGFIMYNWKVFVFDLWIYTCTNIQHKYSDRKKWKAARIILQILVAWWEDWKILRNIISFFLLSTSELSRYWHFCLTIGATSAHLCYGRHRWKIVSFTILALGLTWRDIRASQISMSNLKLEYATEPWWKNIDSIMEYGDEQDVRALYQPMCGYKTSFLNK